MAGSVIAVVPAKGHSRRLEGKNRLLFNGEPLFIRAARCARDAGIFGTVLVSTDDYEIFRAAWKVDYPNVIGHLRRHAIYSDDEVHTAGVLIELLPLLLNYDSFCVLNPTSPLRTPERLREAYDEFIRFNYDCLASDDGKAHDGDFLFWKTSAFVRFVSRSCIAPDALWMAGSGVDINTQEDLDRAVALSSGKGL